MKKAQTRIKCSCQGGSFHTVTFHSNGQVVSSWCDNVTDDARRLAAVIRMGKTPSEYSTCTALAALVLYGCEILLRRPGDEDNVVRNLSGWRDIYIRFETNKVVESTMKRTRARLRREAARKKVPGASIAPQVELSVYERMEAARQAAASGNTPLPLAGSPDAKSTVEYCEDA